MTLSATTLFSPAQIAGYLVLILGVAAFLQKQEGRLKFLLSCECLVYTLHFFLLGNNTAAASACISAGRTFLSLRFQSLGLGLAVVLLNVGLGALLATGPASWIPVAGACVATLGLFTLRGIPMRLALLFSTLCWLTNNLLSGSIGGVILESSIAAANTVAIAGLLRKR
ncbi:YgjV family protein [Desulfovibrio aminophilus]|uniref:YgjV family protein n=1 Tax=Desulfovibrio aminophilus TaxID=81425 RepID=UPI0033988604